MPRAVQRSNGAAVTSVPSPGPAVIGAEPRVDPAAQVITVAGWDGCSSGVVLGALRLIARALSADVCCLCWRNGGLRDSEALDVGTQATDERQRRAWLEFAQSLAPVADHAAPDSALVFPVRDPNGVIDGAFAVRPARVKAGTGSDAAALAAEAASHISQLLASSEAHTARSTAYEALVEIGAQIQAMEVRADAIFALIVERVWSTAENDRWGSAIVSGRSA